MRFDAVADQSDGWSGRGRSQPAFHHRVTDDSGLLVDEFAAREDSEVWNSSNVESSRQLLMLVRIDLEDDGMAGHIGGCARNLWRRSPAGSAPLSPEIDKHRNLRTLNDLVEQFIVRLQRFIDRWERSFTCAATACVREVLHANTIFLTTLFTASNRRHRHLR
jgi:hypothetical protein